MNQYSQKQTRNTGIIKKRQKNPVFGELEKQHFLSRAPKLI